MENKINLHDRLVKIQQELKAPKSNINKFGNYNYRSCEDILEAVKPLLGECSVNIGDTVEIIGDRYYVKATVAITDGKDRITASAYAREELVKKGMDSAQITGAASSYARKYALNGLFAIDDTKDPDTQDNTKQDIDEGDVMDRAMMNTKCPKCGADMRKSSKGNWYCSNMCWKNGGKDEA